MKTNKSTWHQEKHQLVRLKATNITNRSRGKSYANWSTSAKPDWNAPSTILDSKIKSFEVKMLMGANICFFHKKQILYFWPWNTSLAPCICFPPFCKNTKLQVKNREKRSDIVAVCWLNFTNTRFVCFSLLRQRRWKLDCSLVTLNQKAVNIVSFFWKEGLDEWEARN